MLFLKRGALFCFQFYSAKMQLPKVEHKFDMKKVEQILLNENRFITNLLSISAIPERRGKLINSSNFVILNS